MIVQSMPYPASSTPSPTFSNVKLLVGANGTDGSTTFIDESSVGRTLTAVGNAQIDTAVAKFGTGSILLDGAGDCVSAANHSDWQMGTSVPRTVEMWCRFASGANLSVAHDFASHYNSSLNNRGWLWQYDGTLGMMRFIVSTDGSSTFTIDMQRAWSPSVSTDYHVALCRTSANDWRMFVNGVQLGASLSSSAIDYNAPNAPLRIGGHDSSGSIASSFNGWIDEARLTHEAIYTADFTPPAAAFPRS